MSEGHQISFHIGTVVSIDSPYKGGEVKVRCDGIHDDKSAIPDDNLRWTKVAGHTKDAKLPGAGSGHTLLKGTRVMMCYVDAEKQIGFVLHTLGAAGDVAAQTSTTNVPAPARK